MTKRLHCYSTNKNGTIILLSETNKVIGHAIIVGAGGMLYSRDIIFLSF